MFPSRISSSFFVTGASLLLASWATASPITGKYNDKPGYGFAPPRGVYSVERTAEFQRNGTGNPSGAISGLDVSNSTLLVNGGLFKDNNGYGLSAQSRSQITVNGGIIQDNQNGLLVNSRSHALINGGSFANKKVNIAVYDYSRVALNNGVFNCFGELPDFFDKPNSDGGLDHVAAGMVLDNHSFGIVNGGTFSGYGSPVSVGVYALNNSSLIVKNARFINVIRGVNLYDAVSSIVLGGTFGFYRGESASDVLSNSSGIFTCSSALQVAGGTFIGNVDGLFATVHSGRNGKIVIDGGKFLKNYESGVLGLSSPTQTTQITINGGLFSGNGPATPPSGAPNINNYSGGAVFIDGTKAVINDGSFQGNGLSGVVALGPKTTLQINNGDFRKNGKSDSVGGPLFGKGAFIHSGATALINDGNFSNNDIGVQIGLAIPPTDDTVDASGTATINGGGFHNDFSALQVRMGSRCDVNGGDFSGQYSISSRSFSKPNRVRVFGGTFKSSVFDFDSGSNSVIELTGVFDGYDNSHGAVVLPPGPGTLTGQLKLSTKRQKFSYRSGSNGKIILHPTNAPLSKPAKAPSGGSS